MSVMSRTPLNSHQSKRHRCMEVDMFNKRRKCHTGVSESSSISSLSKSFQHLTHINLFGGQSAHSLGCQSTHCKQVASFFKISCVLIADVSNFSASTCENYII